MYTPLLGRVLHDEAPPLRPRRRDGGGGGGRLGRNGVIVMRPDGGVLSTARVTVAIALRGSSDDNLARQGVEEKEEEEEEWDVYNTCKVDNKVKVD